MRYIYIYNIGEVLSFLLFNQSVCAIHPGLKDLAAAAGVYLVDHEVVTLLRHFGVAGGDNQPPRVLGPLALQCAQS